MTHPQQALKTMDAARKWAPKAAMRSSAEICLRDAEKAADRFDWAAAQAHALRSLSYSVGVFSSVYKRAAADSCSDISRHTIDGYNVEFLGASPARIGTDY